MYMTTLNTPQPVDILKYEQGNTKHTIPNVNMVKVDISFLLSMQIRGAYCKELIIPMFEHGPFGLGLDPDRLTVDQALALRR